MASFAETTGSWLERSSICAPSARRAHRLFGGHHCWLPLPEHMAFGPDEAGKPAGQGQSHRKSRATGCRVGLGEASQVHDYIRLTLVVR